MIRNRSVPAASVIPVLMYREVDEAVEWLCRVFGFRERIRVGAHRAQLLFDTGALVVQEIGDEESSIERSAITRTHAVLVRVNDVDAHHERARQAGARILAQPTDYPFGERQYRAEDIGGHRWTFSQSIADVDPVTWGGTAIDTEQA